jgi:hypothetical protein
MTLKFRVFYLSAFLLQGATLALSQMSQEKQEEFAAHMQKAESYLRQKQPALACISHKDSRDPL